MQPARESKDRNSLLAPQLCALPFPLCLQRPQVQLEAWLLEARASSLLTTPTEWGSSESSQDHLPSGAHSSGEDEPGTESKSLVHRWAAKDTQPGDCKVSSGAQVSSLPPDALSAPLELCRRLSSKPGFWGGCCMQPPVSRFHLGASRTMLSVLTALSLA